VGRLGMRRTYTHDPFCGTFFFRNSFFGSVAVGRSVCFFSLVWTPTVTHCLLTLFVFSAFCVLGCKSQTGLWAKRLRTGPPIFSEPFSGKMPTLPSRTDPTPCTPPIHHCEAQGMRSPVLLTNTMCV